MAERKRSIFNRVNAKTKPVDVIHITASESAKISRENRRITDAIERQRKRRNVSESEYLTTMRNPDNVVEFDDLHTYFFTDIGTVKAVDGV
ncbi:MAG: ABC transporter ATP-binding protein, partial [Chloroflexi bacterium]|nr:ABC transporter ATP-binding protein [Chloroflexota bacterium]